MRVISGTAGGIRLQSPTHDLRPTMDRVREAVFSSLGDRVPGSVVLDLFAGSGAFGIEALSRGARSADLVDSHRAAIAVIRANLARAKVHGQVHQMDVRRFLERATRLYDLVFADPPYVKGTNKPDLLQAVLAHPRFPSLVHKDGMLILERNADAPRLDLGPWRTLKQRRYGGTELTYALPPEQA
jgi:16S rRNA (guanine966-N2)-methyltransferase